MNTYTSEHEATIHFRTILRNPHFLDSLLNQLNQEIRSQHFVLVEEFKASFEKQLWINYHDFELIKSACYVLSIFFIAFCFITSKLIILIPLLVLFIVHQSASNGHAKLKYVSFERAMAASNEVLIEYLLNNFSLEELHKLEQSIKDRLTWRGSFKK